MCGLKEWRRPRPHWHVQSKGSRPAAIFLHISWANVGKTPNTGRLAHDFVTESSGQDARATWRGHSARRLFFIPATA